MKKKQPTTQITIERHAELNSKNYLTFNEVAELLNVSITSVRGWARNGHLRVINFPAYNLPCVNKGKVISSHKMKRIQNSEVKRFVRLYEVYGTDNNIIK